MKTEGMNKNPKSNMNFDKKYPDAKSTDSDYLEGIIKINNAKPCLNCGTLARWIDIDFQAYLCSEECQQEKLNEHVKTTPIK